MNSLAKNLPILLVALAAYFFLRPKKALTCAGPTIFGKLTNGASFQTCYHPDDYPGVRWIKVPSRDFGIILVPDVEAQNNGLIPFPDKPGFWLQKEVYDQLRAEFERIRSELRGQLFSTWLQTVVSTKNQIGELKEGEVQTAQASTPTTPILV